MRINRKAHRKKILLKMQKEMKKDKKDPSQIASWLKIMDCKKKLFSLEDEIDNIADELKRKKTKKK